MTAEKVHAAGLTEEPDNSGNAAIDLVSSNAWMVGTGMKQVVKSATNRRLAILLASRYPQSYPHLFGAGLN